MGMFDCVRVDYPLPVAEHRRLKGWQTKSFENLLWTYVLDADGRLWVERYDLESVPEDERPYGDDENPLMRLCGALRQVNERTEPVRFTGTMTFYTHGEDKEWVEYAATFTDGNLLHLRKHPEVDWNFFTGKPPW